MTAMGFPASPSNGDTYEKWTFDAASGSWVINEGTLSLSGSTTDDLAEGSTNLYYTNGRWDSDLDSAIAAGKITTSSSLQNTDSLGEGSVNLYYTQARAKTDFDSGFATKLLDEDNMASDDATKVPSQQSVKAYVDASTTGLTVTNLDAATVVTEAERISANDNDTTIPTSAAVKDYVDSALTASGGYGDGSVDNHLNTGTANAGEILSWTGSDYDWIANSSLSNTDSLAEGSTNLYYTQARAKTDFDSGFATKLIDEDNMASDDATKVPSQQSVKAYVDAATSGLTTTNLDPATLVTEAEGIASNDDEVHIPTTAAVKDYADGAASAILIDEDNMASDDATKAPTQQSVKAYVDASVTGLDTTNLSAAALVTEAEGIASNDNDTTIPTSAAVKDYADGAVTAILIDEDNMASDDATKAPTQQSVKAYVDAQTTDNVAEGSTNFYYTNSRFDSDLDSAIAAGKIGGGGGGSSLWTQSGSDIYYNTGNVGIGTNSPTFGDLCIVTSGETSPTMLALQNSSSGGNINIDFRNNLFAQPVTARIGTVDAGSFEADLVFSNKLTGTSGALTERMRIDADGNVGIGTDSPAKTLDVTGTSRVTGEAAFGNDVVLTNSAFVYSSAGGSDIRAGWYLDGINQIIKGVVAGTERMRLLTSGELHVDGDVVAFSTTISDQKFKNQVETIDNALDKVKALRGVEYTWNTSSRKGQRDMGLIAQEVEKVIPNVVREKQLVMGDFQDNPTTAKTVDYEKLTAVLIEAVKELSARVEELESK